MNTFFKPPGRMFNNNLSGPYYTFGGSSYTPPGLNFEQMMAQAEHSAGFAKQQSELAHAQALEMEATRNAYASAISDRETQNEAQLEAQAQSMESLLGDMRSSQEEEEEVGVTSIDFFSSLMGAMQAGTSNTQTGSAPTGAAGKAPTAVGETVYASRARPA